VERALPDDTFFGGVGIGKTDRVRREKGAEGMSAQGKAEQEFQQEYQKAIERIRTMPDGAVGWVLKFLQTELEALTPTEWTLVAFEVAAFVDETGDRYGGMVAPESGWSVEGVPNAKKRWTFRPPSWSSWSAIGMKDTPPSPFPR
jgi:hypothetical protein